MRSTSTSLGNGSGWLITPLLTTTQNEKMLGGQGPRLRHFSHERKPGTIYRSDVRVGKAVRTYRTGSSVVTPWGHEDTGPVRGAAQSKEAAERLTSRGSGGIHIELVSSLISRPSIRLLVNFYTQNCLQGSGQRGEQGNGVWDPGG